MALGETLRSAREAKGLTPSQVAASTRILVQIIESLEREDFRGIAAPIYGRGFVKLYAETLGLDPAPLVREFMLLYDGVRTPAIRIKEPDVTLCDDAQPTNRTVSGTTSENSPLPIIQHAVTHEEPVRREAPSPTTPQVPVDVAVSGLDLFDPNAKTVIAPEAIPPDPETFDMARVCRNPIVAFFVRLFSAPPRMMVGLEDEDVATDEDVADIATTHDARVKRFSAGLAVIKTDLHQKMGILKSPMAGRVALGVAAVVVLVLVCVGISALFRMTSRIDAGQHPIATQTQAVVPPPLYVD